VQIFGSKYSPCLPLNSCTFIITIILFFLRCLLLLEVNHTNQGQRMTTQEEDGWQCWVSNGSRGTTKIKGREEVDGRALPYRVSGLLGGSN